MKELRMKPHNTEGKLITFCGLDGCGKSSMIEMVTKALAKNGIETIVTKQPTDMMRKTEIFRTFMDCPDNSAYEYRALSLMAAADRIQHVNKIILPALKEGKTVICDRYIYDEWIYEISESILKPDAAFFLDVPVETAVRRVRMRPSEKDRYIDMSLQHLLSNEYIEICNANQGILIGSDTDIGYTFATIKNCIHQILGNRYNLGGEI